MLPILEQLRLDDEEYVRRSVANHLNDIAKDHPQLVVDLCGTWWSETDKNQQRLVRHALRSLVKTGDSGALAVLGYGAPELEVKHLRLSTPAVQLGGTADFEIVLCSTKDRPQRLLIDYAVHHVKANGTRTAKVFKWTDRTLEPGVLLTLRRSHKIRPVTTRRYYPGTHLVEILINGQSMGEASFELSV